MSWTRFLRYEVLREFAAYSRLVSQDKRLADLFAKRAVHLDELQRKQEWARAKRGYEAHIFCRVCGVRMYPRDGGKGRQKEFCSRVCSLRDWCARQGPQAQPKCQVCGEPCPEGQRRYCSVRCCQLARRERQRCESPPCQGCGKPCPKGQRRWCGDECRVPAMNARERARKARRREARL